MALNLSKLSYEPNPKGCTDFAVERDVFHCSMQIQLKLLNGDHLSRQAEEEWFENTYSLIYQSGSAKEYFAAWVRASPDWWRTSNEPLLALGGPLQGTFRVVAASMDYVNLVSISGAPALHNPYAQVAMTNPPQELYSRHQIGYNKRFTRDVLVHGSVPKGRIAHLFELCLDELYVDLSTTNYYGALFHEST